MGCRPAAFVDEDRGWSRFSTDWTRGHEAELGGCAVMSTIMMAVSSPSSKLRTWAGGRCHGSAGPEPGNLPEPPTILPASLISSPSEVVLLSIMRREAVAEAWR